MQVVPLQSQPKTEEIIVAFRTLSHRLSSINPSPKGKTDGKVFDESLIDVHKLSQEEVFLRFATHPTHGLESSALKRLADGPKNTLSPPASNWLWKLFTYLFGGFNSLMWIAMILSILSWEPLGEPSPQIFNLGVGVLIGFVIIVSALFYGFVDYNASQVMKAIMQLAAEDALVTRNGEKVSIPAANLHVGDLVHLTLGDKVPADLFIIEISPDLRFDKSLLTGESEPIAGSIDATDDNPLETRNLALSSTFVVQGSMTGVVFAIGDSSVVGRIVALTANQKPKQTNLQREIMSFTIVISAIAITSFCISMLYWGVNTKKYHPGFATSSAAIINAIGCLTAFVPQGLPVCIALALSVVARRMAARKVLVKNLATVETVGSMSVLCSDKTGTLTEGKMFIEQVGIIQTYKSAEDLLLTKSGEEVLRAFYLCNDARFDDGQADVPLEMRSIRGNSTDVAIYRYSALSINTAKVDETWTRTYSIPFNSKNKWMLTINTTKEGVSTMYLKGGPDVISPFCSFVQKFDGTVEKLTAENSSILDSKQQLWSSQGQRVLMVCSKSLGNAELPAGNAEMEKFVLEAMKDMTILSMVGIRDPPRLDVPETVLKMRQAGVRIFMVTGDFQSTAEAISRQVNIITATKVACFLDLAGASTDIRRSVDMKPNMEEAPRAIVLNGTEVNKMTQEMWDLLLTVYAEIVFARTSPIQKMKIVEEVKARGDNVVGVTGDGVNDAPALKAADIGMAMGSGSDVAKEAAHMILLNNDFASILVAIENGRLVFDNLRKVVCFIMPTGSYTEFITVVANVFFGMQAPLSSYLQVAFSIFNDVAMSISLMFEQPESDLMRRPPRNVRLEHLTDWKFFFQIYCFTGFITWVSCFGVYFYYWRSVGFGFKDLVFAWDLWVDGYRGQSINDLNNWVATSQAIFYTSMTVMQLGNILALRNRRVSIFESNPFYGPRKNHTLFVSMAFHIVVTVMNIYISSAPGNPNIFAIGYVSWVYWAIPVPLALGSLMLDEVRKALVRAYPNSFIAKAAW